MKLARILRLPSWMNATLILFLATIALWKFRIIDTASIKYLMFDTVDLYTEHFPMAAYGFRILRSGQIPLWDPYQLCGLPFLAVPHTGIFYPGNLPYLFFDTGVATEITLILHLLFAAVSMWLLARALGLSVSGAFAGALTFAWSGCMMASVHQAALISGMCWLPATLLLIEGAVRGGGWVPFGLTMAVACQLLNGAPEFFVQNMYVGALFAFFRLTQLALERQWRLAAKRALILVVAVAAGPLLAAVQLMPSIELVAQSVRTRGSQPLGRVLYGWVAPPIFLLAMLQSNGHVAVGFLPLLGIGFPVARPPLVWLFAATVAAAAALLTFGGRVFLLYYQSPLGGLFRDPEKFLHVYAFAQGLMAAIALTQLERWHSVAKGNLWRNMRWLACVSLLVGALCWLVRSDGTNRYLAASLGLLCLFGLSGSTSVRTSVVYALLMLQGAILFLGVNTTYMRPASQAGVFDTHIELLNLLKRQAREQRIYLSPNLRLVSGMTPKQGMLREFRAVSDYETLSMRRYATFFEHVAGRRDDVFAGFYSLGKESRWALMDLTSTRLYVLERGEEADAMLSELSRRPAESGIRSIVLPPVFGKYLDAYARSSSLPRAYYVPRARVVESAEDVLTTLDDPSFDPHREVVLEDEAVAMQAAASPGTGGVRILTDEPERVVVEVEAQEPGFVVLTDAFYPGWRAYSEDRELPIYRANYLFRAVPSDAGRTAIRFEYQPESFHDGMWVSCATAVGLVVVGLLQIGRRGSKITNAHRFVA